MSTIGSNAISDNKIISIRGRHFNLQDGSEILIGLGNHQFAIYFNSDCITIEDPKTKEKIHFHITNPNSDVLERFIKILELKSKSVTSSGVLEYSLDKNSFKDKDFYIINDIESGILIIKIDVTIIEPFVTSPDRQHSIAIFGDNGSILMPDTWNDPNVINSYTTSLNYRIGDSGEIKITHDLKDMISGSAILRLHYTR